MNDLTFKKGIAYIFKCFPVMEKSTDPEAVKVWRTLLSDMMDEEFVTGVIRLCRETREFYPGTNIVAMIREHADKINHPIISAEEAWGEVMKQISSVGFYGTPVWSDPIIKTAIQAIGWKILCHSDEQQLGVHRAHFMRCFGAYLERDVIERTNKDVMDLISSVSNTMNLPDVEAQLDK